MTNKVVEAALQRARSVANSLRATAFGIGGSRYTAYADELNDAADRIDAACFDPPRRPIAPVSEIYIDFTDGTIDGNCSGCTPAEVSDALVQVIAELQMMDTTSSYLSFRNGNVFKGTRFPDRLPLEGGASMKQLLRDMRFLAAELARQGARTRAVRLLDMTEQLPSIKRPEWIWAFREEMLAWGGLAPRLQDDRAVILMKLRAHEHGLER